jgi:hypothetical protein
MRAALVLALIVMMAAPSGASTLCRNNKGALFVRDGGCKKKENVVNPASVGAIGPPGPPGAPGTEGPPGPSNPNANTLNGLTASQIVDQSVAQASGQVASAVLNFLSSSHVVTSVGTVFGGFCSCVQAFCPGGDFLTECNGAVSNDGTGYLTEIDDINPEGCEVCGCTVFSDVTTGVAASATCLTP